MNRRTVIASGSLALFGGVGGTAYALDRHAAEDEPRAAYQDDHPVVYDHGAVELRSRSDSVHLGEAIEFEVTNTSGDDVVLGCQNPWALQRYADGDWQHLTWTASRYYYLCATVLSPGSSRVEELTLSESALESRADDLQGDLRPGRYRFVLLGPAPFPATRFAVLESG